ncbi:hypothetical protein [Pedobacter sp. BMA]|uniref:hypothetical protein n=1 Tax=Pedobacter sp. BMA TaxID=1663685 RepID=UPI00064B5C15|nr:hypothetical protein [Pedobacter sp. BMA]KLT66312.1 hypothetical protein AB669_09260 [Pedobacter sp. BMA]
MKLIKAISVILLPFFVACESDEKKFARAERECSQKNSVDQLDVSLFGYSYDDADSVSIKIQRDGKIIADYKDALPKKYFDSLRHQRYYTIKKNILLTDTLMVKIAKEPIRKIYGFSYAVKPHFTMMNRDFGCEFNSFVMDGEIVNESTVRVVNKSAK